MRREIAERTVRPNVVVVDELGVGSFSGLVQRQEAMQIEELISSLAVERMSEFTASGQSGAELDMATL